MSLGPLGVVLTPTDPATSILVDVGAGNHYNVGNTYGPFVGFPGPFCLPYIPAGVSCIDWTHGESAGPFPGIFVDLSTTGPDAYAGAPLDSFKLDMYGNAPYGLCVDALDGPDVPAVTFSGSCIDA